MCIPLANDFTPMHSSPLLSPYFNQSTLVLSATFSFYAPMHKSAHSVVSYPTLFWIENWNPSMFMNSTMSFICSAFWASCFIICIFRTKFSSNKFTDCQHWLAEFGLPVIWIQFVSIEVQTFYSGLFLLNVNLFSPFNLIFL